jgi:uncharacterized repeat protein (TIGR03803 family)
MTESISKCLAAGCLAMILLSGSVGVAAQQEFSDALGAAATPVLAPGSGTYRAATSVSITDDTPGAVIYYTLDGTTPSKNSPSYAGAFLVGTTTTVKAIATASGVSRSAIASATYRITLPAATPTFNPGAGSYTAVQSVSIGEATSGAVIYYTTDGSTPTPTSPVYAGPITVNTTETLRAIALATGGSKSAVASALYRIQVPAATPTFMPPAGTYSAPQNLSINDATAGATIYYTTNGTNPTQSSAVYAGPISVTSTETVKAMALASGGLKSTVANALYKIVLPIAEAPEFSPPAGSYNSEQNVTISDSTVGATIYYTTDGTTPTQNSSVFAGTISVASSTTIKAIAEASGYTQSVLTAAAYTILPPGITESVLYSFAGIPDSKTPVSSLTLGIDGNLYGTSYNGGANNVGSVFSITPAGAETVLYSFSGGVHGSPDGKLPFTALIQGNDGNFYGTTELGGAFGAGTAFQVTPAGAETVLYSFGAGANGATDGAFPEAALILGSDGNFYGTTASGGLNQAGTVFQLTPAGQETPIYSFAGNSAPLDGTGPRATLIQGNDGSFYGTTVAGGANDEGTVFQVTSAGIETVLYSFANGAGGVDGEEPAAALIQGSDGNFYGTTTFGGTNDTGTVFRLTPAGIETVLHSFGPSGSPDGAYPVASLIQTSDGSFYGTTTGGGLVGTGTIFQLSPANNEAVLYSFASGNGTSDGTNPHAALIQTSDGTFYGSTENGGSFGAGTVFELSSAGTGSARRSSIKAARSAH